MDIRGPASKRGEGEKRRRKGGVLLLREGKEGRGGKGRRKGKGLSSPRKKISGAATDCRHIHSHWSGVFNLLKFDRIAKKKSMGLLTNLNASFKA